jgi:alkylhydroperoxidase family enzyme
VKGYRRADTLSPMAWITTVDPARATGLLKRLYDEAVARAGKVFNVLRCQSVRPRVLEISVKLYEEVMLSDRSPLSRIQREMIAVAVSRSNACHY